MCLTKISTKKEQYACPCYFAHSISTAHVSSDAMTVYFIF